jgi:hypothetical protein
VRLTLLALPLALCSCFATSGDLDKAVADIAGRISVVADSAQASAEAAREAYTRGELTYAELQKRLQDIRAATLEAGEAVTREVVDGLKETIENRPEVVAQATGDVIGGVIPGPLGQIIALAGTAAATYFASSRKAKKDAEDAVWDFKLERTQEHLVKAEAKAEAKK